MKRFRLRYSCILLFLMVFFCSCNGAADPEVVSAVSESSVSADQPEATPTMTPTPTIKPTPTVTPAPAVSADTVSGDSVSSDQVSANGVSGNNVSGNDAASGNKVSENKATPTPLPTPDPAKLVLFETPRTMYVTAQVNIRKGPGTFYAKDGVLNFGNAVSALGRYNDEWVQVDINGETRYIHGSYLSEEVPATPTPAPTQDPAQLPPPPPQVTAPAGVLMIGDSRCVQMRDVTGGGGVSWICENSRGYEWFVSTALGQAEGIIGRGTKVVICLGVNDTDNGYSYSSLINQKAAEWAARGARTYFVSVNPVGDNPWTNNDNVSAFNTIMVNNLSGVKYIDTWSYLVTHGYNMVDGMHFDGPTNATVFSLIISNL